MKGKLTIIRANGSVATEDLNQAPGLTRLQAAVGGYIELVPCFNKFYGEVAVAFCNEEGKLRGLPLNTRATTLWTSCEGTVNGRDVLVGDVAVVTGDRELLGAL